MSEASSLSLVESFTRYFSVEIARTTEQKALVYGVRFRVYCEEFNYEAVDKFPQRLETDEYDEFSRHCLIMHRASGKARRMCQAGACNTGKWRSFDLAIGETLWPESGRRAITDIESQARAAM